MANLNVAVLNICGGAGKSTFAKHCLAPQMPNATRVCIEDWNSGDGKGDLDISAKRFYQLAAQMNADTSQSFLLDIGTSNSKLMMKHFADLEFTREQIDSWVIPVRTGAKDRLDTLRTVAMLLEMGVRPASIMVVPQAVADVDMFDLEFAELKAAVEKLGVYFSKQSVLFNEVFDMLKGSDKNVFQVAQEHPNPRELRARLGDDEAALLALGQELLVVSLARTACANLLSVYKSLPFQATEKALA